LAHPVQCVYHPNRRYAVSIHSAAVIEAVSATPVWSRSPTDQQCRTSCHSKLALARPLNGVMYNILEPRFRLNESDILS